MLLRTMNRFLLAIILAFVFLVSGCATSRDVTSAHYLPEWENQIFNFPNPSETSGGMWVSKTVSQTAHFIGKTLLFPFAILGNIAINAYYIPTWPFRWLLRGDKRLIVWQPIFKVGDDVGSDFYSKSWNQDIV